MKATAVLGWVLVSLFTSHAQEPIIYSISPNLGSIAGGTEVTIWGNGFNTDSYSGSNLVFLGNIPCDVDWYRSTWFRLFCTTRPHPNATEGESYPALQSSIISNGRYYQTFQGNDRFTYHWSYTPQVRAVVPNSGPLNSIVEIGGYRFHGTLDFYERFFIGGYICDTRDPTTNQQYGIRWKWPLLYIKCRITEQQVGGWNATAIVSRTRGTTWNHTEAVYPVHDWDLAMYELYPDIHEVAPSSGGSEGGTLITIQGTGFGITPEDVTVDVAGIPCEIESHSQTEIRCRTGKPPAGSPAVATGDSNYPTVENGFRFRGSRGVSFLSYRGISGTRLEDLYSSSNFPDNPSRYGVYPSFSTEDDSKRNNYGEILTAFFNPRSSGNHTFFVASDDESALWIAQENNITRLEKISSSPYASGYSNYYQYAEQRSEVLELTEGEDYILMGELKEAGSKDFIQVGVLMHETQFTASQTGQANRERQSILISTEGLYDIQTLQLAINKTQLDPEAETPELSVAWGGRSSEPVSLLEMEDDPGLLRDAIFSLFEGSCDYRSAQLGPDVAVHYTGSVFGFENGIGSTDTWEAWNGAAPRIVEYESLCGRHSLYVEESRTLAFDLSPNSEDYEGLGFLVSDYPILCLAYKLPPGHPMVIRINIRDYGWYYIPLNPGEGYHESEVIGNFADYSASGIIIDDDQWHYDCTNLAELLAAGLPVVTDDDSDGASVHQILGFGFYSDPDPDRRGFYVDEVSFSDMERRLNSTNYLAPARPNGIALHDVIMTTEYHWPLQDGSDDTSDSEESDWFSITVALEILPTSCEHNIPLMNITLQNEPQEGLLEFSFSRQRSATSPVGGVYTLQFHEYTTTTLAYDAATQEIASALESLPGVGMVTVEYSDVPIPQDKLGTFCPGRTMTVQFDTLPGDQHMLVVNSSNLTGDGLEVDVKEELTGGLFLRPIPGHMLQTVEMTPQVHVRVREQLASCSGGSALFEEQTLPMRDPCGFIYSANLSPRVDSISPTMGSAGDNIQIHGAGLASDPSGVVVTFDGIECTVISASDDLIECILGAGFGGNKGLYAYILSSGVANTEGIDLQYDVVVSSVDPAQGSDAGGTEIAIAGIGFLPEQNEDSCTQEVLVGGNACSVTSSSYTSITCITPENTGADILYNVSVTVSCVDDPTGSSDTATDAFTYDASLTPVLGSISPSEGSSSGGESIVISGSGFSDVIEENTITLGEKECIVTDSTSTTLTCLTPAHSQGSVAVTVAVLGKGRASGDAQFEFITQVDTISYCSGSLFGGQTLTLEGRGFGSDPSLVDVSLGGKPCETLDVTSTVITCVTPPSTQMHYVDNNVEHPENGLGYLWSPSSLMIDVGDTVEWSWTGSPFATRRSVVQVDGPEDVEYNGRGFRSAVSTTGTFQHSFTTPGTYYYIAGGFGDIGFRGNITVVDLNTKAASLSLTINSVAIDLDSAICSDTGASFDVYSYSVDHTPIIESVIPALSSYLDGAYYSVRGISDFAADNTFTLGGLACIDSDPQLVATTRNSPDFRASVAGTVHQDGAFDCMVPLLAPGSYRATLHVAGRGWAHASLDSTTVLIEPAVRGDAEPQSGSVRGGLELSIFTRGLMISDVTKTRVTIGNTPCLVQRIDNDGVGTLTCIAQPAKDDGYSSIVVNDSPLTYWSLQNDYFSTDGSYIESDNLGTFRSVGSLGEVASASVVGEVMLGQAGISENDITNQAAFFSASYIQAPVLDEFSDPAGFGLEFWMKVAEPDSDEKYRIVVESVSERNGNNSGYMVLLNPCNELEFWLAPGSEPSTSSNVSECSLITNLTTQCSQSCSGYVIVPESSTGNLPTGVWHVIRSSQSDWLEWHHIQVGWEASEVDEDPSCTEDYVCSGTQVLYVNSNSASLAEVTYLPSVGTTLKIGGTSLLSPMSSDSQLSHFSGYLDEVAFYSKPLTASQVAEHYFYGSTENQPIWITVDGVDGIGTGVTPNVEYLESESAFEEEMILDWDSVQEMEYVVENDTAIRIEWTGLHGIRQVSRTAYESCDLEAPPLRQWSPNRGNGSVTVWLQTGAVHYLVDSVVDNCLQGKKIQVRVGQVEAIEWRVRSYEDITVTEGTGLLFSWEGATHDLLEMSSAVSSPSDCQQFVGPKARDLGKLVREWQGMTSEAEVAVTGLSVGAHHFTCSVPGHCPAGMRFTVTVVPEGGEEGERAGEDSDETGPTEHTLLWKIPTELYDPLTITEGEIVIFAWEGFHSLNQVTEDVYDSCDVTAEPLFEWGAPSVDNSASLSDLTPGTYYFICSVPGHCDAGMKLIVNVLPDDGLPVIVSPVGSKCHVGASSSYCSFAYTREATPRLDSIQPTQSHTGTTLSLTGQGLIPSDPTLSTQVWIDKTPCDNVITQPDDTLQCTIQAYESGFYHVDVFVEGEGFASVSSTALSPGPIRNATFPTNINSPYPVFFLAATANAIVPSEGSLAGGTHVTISGTGFSQISERLAVTLGDSPCVVTSSSYSEIKCITGVGVATSDHLVDVSIDVNGFPASTSIQYSYASSATPVITGVSGNSLVGGDEIQLSGDNFGASTADLQIQIVPPGSSYDFDSDANNLCTIVSSTSTAITCTAPPMAANSYQILVYVQGLGLSQGEATISYALQISAFSPTSVGHGGGVVVSMSGNGFPTSIATSEEITITICEASCRITEASVTQLNCTLGPNNIESPFNTTTSCNITASYRNIEASSTDEFQFIGLLTPNLVSITPNIGGTGGGTIVTITGSGFFPSDVFDPNMLVEEDITVSIDKAVCEWFGRGTLPSDTSIECRTSEHPIIREAEVRVFVRGKGYTLATEGPVVFEYIDRWSSRYTWGGGPLPQEGESVYIQSGQTVILDISPPVLNLLLIEGALIFDDSQDLHLQAKYIFINTGKLQVGTEEEPFQHNAMITLHGSITDPEIPIYGAKVLGIRQGELDLHGRPRAVTWVRLEETARTNDTTLHVQQPVDWISGDKIVIAPTGRDGNETEEGEIASVSADGYYIELTTPLSYTHHGITEVYEDGQFIEIRAEVGLLSHNVIVQGTRLENPTGFEGLGANLYGAQILIHRMGPHPTPIRIEHTEVRFMGQAFRLGRYAIHFHLSGSMNGSYVRHCAIHHSANRALTAHGVHDLLIEGNVAYDIMGHTFFVEDGIETNNRYLGNLGVLTRGSSSLLNTDQIPATFWITNPKNIFIGNAAAASRAYGFWYDLDDLPSGASRTGSVCPNKMSFGEFRDNVAHTCNEFGLRIWETYQPFIDGCGATERDIATLYNLTSYSNGINGLELSVVGHVRLVGFKVADNVENGMVVTETHGDWGGPLIMDSLIISYTNVSTGPPGRAGIQTGNTDKLTISGVTFVNFNLPSTFCLHACHQCKMFQGGFQVWLEGLKFLGGSELYKTSFQWEHEVLFKDLDGTLTGLDGGGWVTADSELYPPQYCTKSIPEFSVNTAVPGSRCTPDVYFLRMAWNRAEPLSTLKGVDVNVTNEFGGSVVPWRHYRLTHLDGYMFTMPSGHEHRIVWLLPDEHKVDTTSYSAGFYGMRERDYVWITHEFVMLPNHLDIGGNYEPTDHEEIPTVDDTTLSWHIDNETNEGTYFVTGTNLTDYHSQLFSYSYQACPRTGCPPPGYEGPLEDDYRRWSENSSWPAGHPPLEGEDVIITSRWRMLLDVTPPTLGMVYVLGELNFEDERDYNFTANLILVHGPNAQLIIGTEDAPFTHTVVITLTGRRSDDNLALTNSLSLGSKAIGVFGNVSIHGQPKTRTWTRLASSALAGDDQITLQGNDYPNWEEGEEIVIAPSGYDPEEAEIRTIINYDSDSGVVTLDAQLEFDHLVHRFLESQDLNLVSPEGLPSADFWWGDGGQLAPEVGLLTHQIIIQGGEDPDEPLEFHHYGCRLLVGEYSAAGFTYTGRLQLDSVEFRFCGQGGYFSPTDPRYAIAFRNSFDSSEGSYIRRCSLHHGYSTAIGIHTANGIEISQNVVWRTTDSSIKVGGRGNLVLDNLAMMTSTVQPNRPSDSHAVDFPATFDIDRGNTVRGNAAAGSTRLSFRFGGEPCLEGNQPPTYDAATFWDNTAHSGLIGMNVLGLPSSCTAIGGFTAAFHWNYAVFSSLASSLVATHMKIAVGKVGFNLNVFGPNPVRHLLGRKSITIADSLIVGSLPDESCETSAPSYRPGGGVSFALNDHKLGIMMSSFNQRRSKMDGTGAWHLMKGYPVIDGVVFANNLAFARFFDSGCSYNIYTVGNNPLSPDAVHPMHMTETTLFNVEKNSLAFFYEPDVAWIVQEDCVDMDCDGPKHALVRDTDGRFVGSYPTQGSVVPFAEIRFANWSSRIPLTWLASEGYNSADEAVQHMGVARGETGNLDSLYGGCVWVEAWQAYCCRGLQHHMLVSESMDDDTETRRLSPLALNGGDTGAGHYTDLLNGPMDHGWCTYYTCLKRLSTFFSIVVEGTDYCLWMTGSEPLNMRFHLLNADSDDAISLCIWYKNTQRKDIYKNGVFIEPENVEFLEGGGVQQLDGNFIPSRERFSGSNYFDRESQILHLVIKGSDPIEVRTAPVVQVSLNLAVSIDDFFSPGALINNLAFVLRIDPSRIRIVKIISEDTPLRRRRNLLAANEFNYTTVTFEFGEPPALNVSTPEPPSVAMEIAMTGETNDSVDLEQTEPESTPLEGSNPLNEDPPDTVEEFVDDFNITVGAYTDSIQVYVEAVEAVEEANLLGEQVVNLLLTGGLEIENATLTSFSVIPAAPPAPPTPPSIPPTYENATIDDEPVEEIVVEVPTLPATEAPDSVPQSTGDGIDYDVLSEMRVTMEPLNETGHLVHVAVSLFYVNGNLAVNLGLVNPWLCEATLVHDYGDTNNAPQLGGETSTPFVRGRAIFTRLRVDRPSMDLTLTFRTDPPSQFEVTTSVSFTVVAPSGDTAQEHVVFALEGDTSSLGSDLSSFVEVVREMLAGTLDVDLSRLQNVMLIRSFPGLIVSMDILERAPTAPSDVPTLEETTALLEEIVNGRSAVIYINEEPFTATSGSLPEPTVSPAPTDIPVALIAVMACAGGLALTVGAVVGLYCFAVVWKRGKKRKGKKGDGLSISSSEASDTPLHRIVQVNPLADISDDSDGEIILDRTTPFQSTAHLTKPVFSLNVPSTPGDSSLVGDETDETSLGASSSGARFGNIDADCWVDLPSMPLPSHPPPTGIPSQPGPQPTTLAGLANQRFPLHAQSTQPQVTRMFVVPAPKTRRKHDLWPGK